MNLASELRAWALKNKITMIAVTELLKLLHDNGIDNIHTCARTLLKTPGTTELGNGEFWYSGIAVNLIQSLSTLEDLPTHIEL